jgi:predicted ferric reductase
MRVSSWGILVFAIGVRAIWPHAWIIGEACHQDVLYSFDDCNRFDIQCLCSNKNFLASVVLCISDYETLTQTRAEAWDHFSENVCKDTSKLEIDQNYKDAIEYLKTTKLSKGPLDIMTATNVTGPVRVSPDDFDDTYRSVHNYLEQKDISVWQGSFLVGWWLLIMLVASISKGIRYMAVRFSNRRVTMDKPGALTRAWQKYIAIPACFGFRHMCKINFLGMSFMVPTRGETVAIGIYFGLNLIFLLTPYSFLQHDILYPTHWQEMLRFVSDRSGIIGVIQLPLVTLFALRNNFLIWMTGWNYSSFNTYHRAVSRVMYCQFIVHSVTKHVFSAGYGSSLVKYFYPLPYYRWGVAAMFLMAIMIGSGTFRAKWYEIFLRLHVLCAIGAYVCTIYHLNGLGYKQTVYVAYALWSMDWIIRFSRIVFLNVSLFLAPAAGSARTTFAEVCTIRGDLVNLRIRTPVNWRAKPGQYVFVQIGRLRFWEAHPFSVVGPSNDGESFQLFCKSRGGMTKRFCKRLSEKGADKTHPMTMAVMVEGPYGVHCPVERYDNCILVAGGVGITGVIPYVELLAHQPHQPRVLFMWIVQFHHEFHWVEQHLERIAATGRVELQLYAISDLDSNVKQPGGSEQLGNDSAFSIVGDDNDDDEGTISEETVYNTQEIREQHFNDPHFQRAMGLDNNHAAYSTTVQEKNPADDKKRRNSNVRTTELTSSGLLKPYPYSSWQDAVSLGVRPDLALVIEDFFRQADGSTCALGCGPPSMMDTMRQSVCRNLDLPNGRVDYFEEAYSW